jgi:outer membrane protein OmpA-like peptidoglycan-associated protein
LQIDSYRKVQFDDAGDLKLTGTNAHHESAPDTQSKFEVLVNGRSTSLPVVHAEGEIGEPGKRVHVKADVLDDFNFPLLLSYEHVESHFKHSLVKIDFAGELEQQLETEKHADIYGVYFDFGSDVMRPESDLVLQEVAEVMKKHPDWKLQVDGHTDNVGGGGAANLDLSRRRAAVVRVALMQRFAISADRLATGGFGAGRPKKTNDTIEGRALNRRVELRRF